MLGDAVEWLARGVFLVVGVTLGLCAAVLIVVLECVNSYWRGCLVLVAIAAVVVLGRCG